MKELIKAPSRASDQFCIRFPDGMRDACKELAKKNYRSLNAELVSMIEAQLKVKNAAQ